MKSKSPRPKPYKSERIELDAALFNRVRLSVIRLGAPWCELLGANGVELQLHRASWFCSDRKAKDTALVTWTDFARRCASTDQPVACLQILYSAYAGLLVPRILAELDRRLALRLAADRPQRPAQVHSLPAPFAR